MVSMATSICATVNCFSFSSGRKASLLIPKACLPTASNTTIPTNILSSNPDRRSGNYKPPTWHFDYIQSIDNHYAGDNYTKRFNKLKKEMRKKMIAEGEELEKLELTDNLQRLGLSYHFKEEILEILRSIHQEIQESSKVVVGEYSLYATALKFKLLREHGFDISPDAMLNNFTDEDGNLKESVCKDIKGLLQLYEASFLSTETENTLKIATRLTESQLKSYLAHDNDQYYSADSLTATLVHHALEHPRHWMMVRLETRWYIDIYERMPNASPLLLELAKLDFNIVQATHQEELRNVSRWWKSTCLAEKLPFSRDRLPESFFWGVGMAVDPRHGYCRRMVAKLMAMVSAIDDIYDIYGSYDELELFTDAVERWDIKAMEQLPEYMKVMYLALFNSINEMAYETLKEQGINVLPYLTKAWADLCKAYLREAKWYYEGYKPTLQEYMGNAWMSITMPMILIHAFCFITKSITKEALESLRKYPDVIRLSSTIFRFADDLATSSDELERGDVLKSIQCYMNEKGASEDEAREHIKSLIKENWELMNRALMENSQFSEAFVEMIKDFVRTAQCMYLHGDGHGIQTTEIKTGIFKVLFEPITISNPLGPTC
uniref:Geraniol synthase n=1 Tax=Petunia hybrida TaxID=4102 RepID=A0A482ER59_PETHY|nr:geraniol synthase [Petunia x hybrida]